MLEIVRSLPQPRARKPIDDIQRKRIAVQGRRVVEERNGTGGPDLNSRTIGKLKQRVVLAAVRDQL